MCSFMATMLKSIISDANGSRGTITRNDLMVFHTSLGKKYKMEVRRRLLCYDVFSLTFS